MATTLHDVAQACGVDVSTVSRALRGDTRVAGATADRIRAAAERLGYRPNLAARGLQAGSTSTVWFLVGSLEEVHERRFATAVSQVLDASGYDLLCASHRSDPVAYERLLGRLGQGLADAVIIVPGSGIHPESPALRLLLTRRFPLIFLDRTPGWDGIPAVTTDNAAASRELVRRLAARGVRHLVVAEENGNDVATARRETALAEGAALGLSVGLASAFTAERIADRGMLGILASSQTGIHGFCTRHAAVLRDHGMRFACFDAWDGEPYPAPEVLVAEQDFPGMARLAAERLLAMVASGADASGRVDRLPLRGIREIQARL